MKKYPGETWFSAGMAPYCIVVLHNRARKDGRPCVSIWGGMGDEGFSLTSKDIGRFVDALLDAQYLLDIMEEDDR